jgi:hypothetical protein
MNPIEIYNRCMCDKPYSNELKLYSKNYLEKTINELALLDEFEKCIDLKKFIEVRFNLI